MTVAHGSLSPTDEAYTRRRSECAYLSRGHAFGPLTMNCNGVSVHPARKRCMKDIQVESHGRCDSTSLLSSLTNVRGVLLPSGLALLSTMIPSTLKMERMKRRRNSPLFSGTEGLAERLVRTDTIVCQSSHTPPPSAPAPVLAI